jgi:hypothetical protein
MGGLDGRARRVAAARWASGVVLLLAVGLGFARPLLVVDEQPIVHLRWRADLLRDQREALERRFDLSLFAEESPTWRYAIGNTGRSNIEALVLHPDVADTHHIDREGFSVNADAPLSDLRPGPISARFPAFGQWAATQGPWHLLVLALAIALLSVVPGAPGFLWNWGRLHLSRIVPALTPHAFGTFRVVLGLALVWWGWWHLSYSGLIPGIQYAAMAAAGLFAAGIAPGVTFPIVLAGTVSMAVGETLVGHGSHPFGVLLLPLACLLFAPWREAPHLLELIRRDGGHGQPDQRYGYAPWILGLGLGVAFAAAAWAKLDNGGAWILTGSVRYAWVADGERALVDWGLRVATMPWASVGLSAAAVLIEASVLIAVLMRSARIRLVAAIAALGLLVGFYLLQGLLWPAWWLLLLGLLPWQWLNREPSATVAPAPSGGRAALSGVQQAAIVLLLVQQVIASAADIELRPVMSSYDMYSAVHASPAEFDRTNPVLRYRVVTEDARQVQTDITSCLEYDVFESLTEARGTVAMHAEALSACVQGPVEPVRYLVLEDWRALDWTTGRLYWRHRDKVTATVPTSASAPATRVR